MSDERSRVRERFGLLPRELVARLDALDRRPVWVQAVSVGEVMLARTLMEALARRESQGHAPIPLVLSSTTRAGLSLAGSFRVPSFIGLFRFPLDLPRLMDRALAAIRPAAYVSVETEIWPMLLRRCAARGVPAIVVNGRISERSRARYRLVRPLMRRPLGAIRLACMQSREDADRIESIGLPPGRTVVTGNMKFDGATGSPPPPALAERVKRLADGRPIVVAGSTCDGEEDLVLEAVAAAGEPFLVLAPRHPDRFETVASLLERRGASFVRRSSPPTGSPAGTLLLDTVGDLAGLYALATVAFVGGSLVPRGGQNMIEPAAHGIPVLFGPHTQHFAAVADALVARGGARRVDGAAGLARAMAAFIASPEEARRCGEAGRSLVAEHRGATERTLRAILPCLEPGPAAAVRGQGCA